MVRAFYICLIIPICFIGCITQKKAGTPIEEKWSEGKYIETANRYMELPNLAKLFNLMDRNQALYPASTSKLVDNLIDKEEALLMFYEKQNDLIMLRFIHNHLRALTLKDPLNIRAFYRDLARKFAEQSFFATAKYYKTINGFFISHNEYVPLVNISKANDLLAEIDVVHSFKTNTGLVRTSYPYFCGSGFLVGPTHVLTAYHVIDKVFYLNTVDYRIDVRVLGKTFTGVKVLGWDSLTDTALLGLPEAVPYPYDFYKLLGDSSDLTQGYEIFCLGLQSSNTQTLTKGIVSTANRKAPEVGSWIQVDAAVSPGQSGGLLIGTNKLIYGMIVGKVTGEDIDFVLPSNLILNVLDKLERSGVIERPWLGLILSAKPGTQGDVSIFDIFPSSPLWNRDIRAGDRLAEINNEKIDSIGEAQDILFELEPGNIVKVGIMKTNGQKYECFSILARRPDFPIYNAMKSYGKIFSLYDHFGFEVTEKPAKSGQFAIKGENEVLNLYMVTKVTPQSYMDSKGVKVGDFIGFINDYYENKTRYIEVLHILPDHPYTGTEIYDHIYFLKKEKYDENIL